MIGRITIEGRQHQDPGADDREPEVAGAEHEAEAEVAAAEVGIEKTLDQDARR